MGIIRFIQSLVRKSKTRTPVPVSNESEEPGYNVISQGQAKLTYSRGPVYFSSSESVEIHGFSIPGPVFVAKGTPPVGCKDLATVYAGLAVEKCSSHVAQGTLNSYRDLTAAQRYVYLQWLSSGRGETADLGYPLLFLATIETFIHRQAAGSDVQNERIDQEVEWILSEVERLLTLNFKVRAIVNAAGGLIDSIYLLRSGSDISEALKRFPCVPTALIKYSLSYHTTRHPGVPLPAELGYQWLVNQDHQCQRLNQYGQERFHAIYTHSGGIVPGSDKAIPLTLSITPLNTGLGDIPTSQCTGVFELTEQKRTLRKLRAIYDKAVDQGHLVESLPDCESSVDLILKWRSVQPPAPVTESVATAMQTVRAHLLGGQISTYGQLATYFGHTSLTRRSVGNINDLVFGIGLSVIPNTNHIPYLPKAEEDCCFVAADGGKALSVPANLVLASLRLIHEAAHLPDRKLSEPLVSSMLRHVPSYLPSNEQEILRGYITWQSNNPPLKRGIQQIKGFVSCSQHSVEIARGVVAVICDGLELTSEVVRGLHRSLKKAGISESDIPTYIHQHPQIQAPKLPGQSADHSNKEVQISASITLDPVRLEQYKKDTQQIQSVLSSIFEGPEDNDHDVSPGNIDLSPADSGDTQSLWFEGYLSSEYAPLATWIMQHDEDEIDMDAVVAKCRSLSIPTEGALEAINDAAFDALGDALIEISDPVIVYRDMLEGGNA